MNRDPEVLPNFFLIGSSRAGTTSLYHHLAGHPDVFVTPRLEPRFFVSDDLTGVFSGPADHLLKQRIVADWGDYLALFSGACGETAVGEVSPAYLDRRVASRIHARLPKARIVAVLRNPVIRALSSFRLEKLDGVELAPSLRRAIELEGARRDAGWSYVWQYFDRGLYFKHLEAYFDLFGPEQISVWLYEDWQLDGGHHLLDGIFKFLRIADDDIKHRQGVIRVNTTSVDRFDARGIERPNISVEDLAWLTDLYKEDVLSLARLIDRDLSAWVTTPETHV